MTRKTHSSAEKPAAAVSTRRKFLQAATGVAGGVAALGFPMIAKGQTGPISMRWQSTWPSKDIFHEYANDFAKKVNDMTGGDLKIEVLPAGAVVPAFGLLDAVSKGTLDGGHGVLVYHYGKQNALALWGSGPAFGMDANMLLAWHKYGGGKDLLNKLYASIGANVVSYPYGPMPTQPLGVQGAVTKNEISRSQVPHGRHLDRRVTGLGCGHALPAGEIVPSRTGLLDSASSTRSSPASRFPVSRRYASAELPPEAEQFEPCSQDEIRCGAARLRAVMITPSRRRLRMSLQAVDRYRRTTSRCSKTELKFYKTPDPVLQTQLTAYDAAAAKKSAENPLFKEIEASQKSFAERAVRWDLDTNVSRRMAYNHYFAKAQAPAKKS